MEQFELDTYQTIASRTDVSRGHDSASFLLLGLFGEAGSVLSEVKKKERDSTQIAEYQAKVTEEVGDVLWYISTVANRNEILLSEIAQAIISRRKKIPPLPRQKLTFLDLQPAPVTGSSDPTMFLEWRLIEFAEASGQLVIAHRDFLKDKRRNRPSLVVAFSRVLDELVKLTTRAGISLESAARRNIEKTESRWPSRRILHPLYDENFPKYERLPQTLLVDIIEERISDNQYFVYQVCNGIHIGDRLTDNIADPDLYRFHDVFHYAYAAVLGWSPVTRSLFKTKRKSDKVIDEAQDGARATLIEEGISAIVFNAAKKNNFFLDVARGKLSFDLLKTIQSFVEGYEVATAPLWAWEEAILQGYEAFRFLKEHRAATIAVNGREMTVGTLKK